VDDFLHRNFERSWLNVSTGPLIFSTARETRILLIFSTAPLIFSTLDADFLHRNADYLHRVTSIILNYKAIIT